MSATGETIVTFSSLVKPKMDSGIVLTKIIPHCKNETTHLVGSKQFDDPRGWGNAIFEEGKLWKKLNSGQECSFWRWLWRDCPYWGIQRTRPKNRL
jgi:hypothetical protein